MVGPLYTVSAVNEPAPQHIPALSLTQVPERTHAATTAMEALGPSSGSSGRPPIRSLYIHTPFCIHKCHYCDFYSFVDTRDQQEAFLNRLTSELRFLAPHAAGSPLKTIFVGGGTPSLLRLDLWERLLTELDRLFDLSLIRRSSAADEHGLAEFTVECNPESTTLDLLSLLRSRGVNRVSVGAQSFHPHHLKTLERRHNPENVARAIETARTAGIPRQSLDLIFAIPGQTLAEWAEDLRRGLALRTTHISCYNLTYEPNTAMTKRLEFGEFEPVDEDVETEMFELTVRTLADAGLPRYEVSNFAAAGQESRHNIAYWLQDQWLAAGPSASGHALGGAGALAGSHRWKNVPRLGDYLASPPGPSPIGEHEGPDPLRLARERLMMGLRLAKGMDGRGLLADVDRLSPGSGAALRAEIERQVGLGNLNADAGSGRWRLTDAGFLLCDAIAAELMSKVG